MRSGNYRLALKALRSSRWQSAMTMFGIVVGIVSVITTVSMGEGIKRQVLGEINYLGSDLITVRPGKGVERDASGVIKKVDNKFIYGFGSGSLSDQDVAIIQGEKGVKISSPLRLLEGSAKVENREFNAGYILGTSDSLPEILQQKVEYGVYFSSGDENRKVAVVGKQVAEQLFQENVPIGQTLQIRGEDFIVRGVFEQFKPGILGQGIDLNKAIFVPNESLKEVAGAAAPVTRVLVRPTNPDQAKKLAADISNTLREAHGGQDDFTVLRQDENLQVAGGVLDILTGFISAIAGISLLVGGIGIMNIMLVSVSERTREIGIRKAVGATNRQILNQFLSEAIVLSVVGGIFGVVLSFIINFIIKVSTNFQPVISWQMVVIASGVSIAVGIIFGTVPAVKAARKDPIEALRVGT
jgi:putative ABC transport system permease protein